MNKKLLINVTISVLVLLFLFYHVPLDKIIPLIVNSKWSYICASIFIAALSIVVNAWRWRILLLNLGYDYDFPLISKISFITFFLNVYMPGGIAGEVARIAMLPPSNNSPKDKKVHLIKITASVVTDKIIGLHGIMLLAFIGFCLSYNDIKDSQIIFVFILISIGLSGITLILYSRRIQNWVKTVFAIPVNCFTPIKITIKEVIDSLLVYRDNFKVINKVIPISILGHLLVSILFILLAESVGVSIDYFKMFIFIPIVEFVSSLPISLGGLGIREATTIFLFGLENIPDTIAMSISLLSFAVILFVGAYGGVLFFVDKSKKTFQNLKSND